MINRQKISQEKRSRRRLNIRNKIFGTAQKPRLSVYRSLKHIYAQLVDDEKGRTLVSASDLNLGSKTKKLIKENAEQKESVMTRKVKIAYEVGKALAQAAKSKHIKKVVFDRGGFRYHGRVKALADGARAGGLEF